MKIKSDLVKYTTAAALTVTGVGVANTVSSNLGPARVEAATFAQRVRINYVAGYGINVWDNYQTPKFTGTRIKHGKTVTVLASAIDQKGRSWYQIGEGQWIQARYTVKESISSKVSQGVQASNRADQAQKVVNVANAAVGKAYVQGSNGPSAFDCSGLTQYVYSKATGKQISRTTYTQVKKGKKVSMQNLQPGDLLFWGSASAPYHVGIYVGDNQFVHAAAPKQGVVKASLSSYFYPSVAKRVLD
ncbi:C40 family peptidase [Lactobacillus xylocopicola]|uniref:C40 family peptidase n=1 Tax=Lactobacillus xylocopicola TaxID=2976676 RepID=UPI0029551633|nr:C40 family peptidase [Lactobacillus xylocopicola]